MNFENLKIGNFLKNKKNGTIIKLDTQVSEDLFFASTKTQNDTFIITPFEFQNWTPPEHLSDLQLPPHHQRDHRGHGKREWHPVPGRKPPPVPVGCR